MKVVIAQHGAGRPTQVLDKAQRVQRSWTTVDKIASEPDYVSLRIELHFLKQLEQGIKAALNVANHIVGHIEN